MLYIDPKFSILAVCLIMTLPLDWLLSAATAAWFHEICHLIMLRIFRIPVYKIEIGIFGAKIDAASGTEWQNFFAAAAGPFGSLLLCLLYRHMPKIAICAAVQALFNLLPVYPMDGGRMLRAILEKICPRFARKAEGWVQFIVMTAAAVFSLYISCAYDLGVFPAALCLAMIIKGFCGKRPCKRGKNRVQ